MSPCHRNAKLPACGLGCLLCTHALPCLTLHGSRLTGACLFLQKHTGNPGNHTSLVCPKVPLKGFLKCSQQPSRGSAYSLGGQQVETGWEITDHSNLRASGQHCLPRPKKAPQNQSDLRKANTTNQSSCYFSIKHIIKLGHNLQNSQKILDTIMIATDFAGGLRL